MQTPNQHQSNPQLGRSGLQQGQENKNGEQNTKKQEVKKIVTWAMAISVRAKIRILILKAPPQAMNPARKNTRTVHINA